MLNVRIIPYIKVGDLKGEEVVHHITVAPQDYLASVLLHSHSVKKKQFLSIHIYQGEVQVLCKVGIYHVHNCHM